MTQKGFSLILTLIGVLVVTGLVIGAYYLGTSGNKYKIENTTIPTQVSNPSPTATAYPKFPPPSSSPEPIIPPLKSTKELPDIASVVVSYAIKLGLQQPYISFKSNDGNFAFGDFNDKAAAGGALWFATKINDKWTVVAVGNGNLECASLAQYGLNNSNIPKEWGACY